MEEKFNNGEICDYFENGLGRCFLNGSRCDCPFSKKGCEIQCKRIFKKEPEGEGANRYTVNMHISKDEKLRKVDVYNRVGIKKGMITADWFIPYSEFDISNAVSSDLIDHGIEEVKRKFDDSDYYLKHLRIYYNVEIAGQIGVYIIGIDPLF